MNTFGNDMNNFDNISIKSQKSLNTKNKLNDLSLKNPSKNKEEQLKSYDLQKYKSGSASQKNNNNRSHGINIIDDFRRVDLKKNTKGNMFELVSPSAINEMKDCIDGCPIHEFDNLPSVYFFFILIQQVY